MWWFRGWEGGGTATLTFKMLEGKARKSYHPTFPSDWPPLSSYSYFYLQIGIS